MSDWTLLADGGDQDALAISQVVQSTLAKAGINIKLDLKQGSEFIDALLGGKFVAVFGGVGNVQKFPTRLATNSIYRTNENNPILGNPNPFPAYVAAISRVNTTFGSQADIRAAYANLNQVLVQSAFGITTSFNGFGCVLLVKLYPKFQEYFRKWKPPLLAIWGKNDPFFIPAGAEAFRKDLPNAEVQFLDTGHFATETHVVEIAAAMKKFLDAERLRRQKLWACFFSRT